MTREEAIIALGDRNNLLWGMSKEEKKYYSEALDMAISALSEQKPLKERMEQLYLVESLKEDFEKLIKENERLRNALSENKGEWIPVSERLPEEEYEVLCQLSDDSCAVLYVQDNWGQMDWVDGQMGTGAYDVIAWQPLPEPYKAESGDEI